MGEFGPQILSLLLSGGIGATVTGWWLRRRTEAASAYSQAARAYAEAAEAVVRRVEALE